jgi:hypothetical protein
MEYGTILDLSQIDFEKLHIGQTIYGHMDNHKILAMMFFDKFTITTLCC